MAQPLVAPEASEIATSSLASAAFWIESRPTSRTVFGSVVSSAT
jgi:hypothetical protein